MSWTLVHIVKWMSTWRFMTTKGQGHSLTFVQGHSDSTFSNVFSKTNTRPLEAEFYMEPPWDVRMKNCSNVPGHMTKVASRPIYTYVKTFKNLLLRNQEADDLETWYTTSGTQVLQNLFKWWYWVDLDHFYDMVQFVSFCFCMGDFLYSI